MLNVEPKVQLSRADDNNYSLTLTCNCAIVFVSQAIVKGMKERGGKRASWLEHWPPILGILRVLRCGIKLATCPLSIDNQLNKIEMDQCGPTIW